MIHHFIIVFMEFQTAYNR